MDLKTLIAISEGYRQELVDYRLSGDLNILLPFINSCINAQDCLTMNHNIDDFMHSLTATEKTALLYLRQMDLTLNISVVKLIQSTKISRPVWTALFQKMEKYGIARISNQGVKGTHIELLYDI